MLNTTSAGRGTFLSGTAAEKASRNLQNRRGTRIWTAKPTGPGRVLPTTAYRRSPNETPPRHRLTAEARAGHTARGGAPAPGNPRSAPRADENRGPRRRARATWAPAPAEPSRRPRAPGAALLSPPPRARALSGGAGRIPATARSRAPPKPGGGEREAPAPAAFQNLPRAAALRLPPSPPHLPEARAPAWHHAHLRPLLKHLGEARSLGDVQRHLRSAPQRPSTAPNQAAPRCAGDDGRRGARRRDEAASLAAG